MIPKTALCALTLLMAVSCAFGFCLRGILNKAIEERKTAKKWRWIEQFEADHDDWSEWDE